MDSHDPEVGFESVGSQQTRLSGFFRNVHSKFSGLLPVSKKDPEGVDVVVTSDVVVRKKPLLVIGNLSPPKAAPTKAERGCLDGLPPIVPVAAPLWSNVNITDAKKGVGTIQVSHSTATKDSVILKPSFEGAIADCSNGDAVKQPRAGAGTKRKATELEVCGDGASFSFSCFKLTLFTITVPHFLIVSASELKTLGT